MTLLRRLRTYFIGFFIGMILVAIFFNDRLHFLTDWLPENRVRMRLQATHDAYTPAAMCRLDCIGLDTSHVAVVVREGKVRFKYSDTRTEPKRYRLDYRFGENLVRMTFDAYDSTATLSQVELPNQVLQCCEDL